MLLEGSDLDFSRCLGIGVGLRRQNRLGVFFEFRHSRGDFLRFYTATEAVRGVRLGAWSFFEVFLEFRDKICTPTRVPCVLEDRHYNASIICASLPAP